MKLKYLKRLPLLALLFAVLALSGCQASADVHSLNQDDQVTQKQNLEGFSQVEETSDEGEEDTITFEMVLGRDIKKLSEKEIEGLRNLYSQIENFEFVEDGSTDEDYYSLLEDFDYKMRDFGLDVPFISYSEVADQYKNQIDSKDYNQIINLDEEYIDLSNSDRFSEEDAQDEKSPYNQLVREIEALFDKNALPGEEITTQVTSRSVHYALYDVSKGGITLSEDSIVNSSQLTHDDQVLYHKLWQHIVKIVPEEYMDKLVKFEVNTDGVENIMAHVVEETEDYSKWRLAIDLKDSINPDGSFSDEFTNTVIHEFAHVMTLHKDELQGDFIRDKEAYSTEEGYLKTNSYLNQFYQKFWTKIADEHAEAEGLDGEDEAQSGTAIYDFYEKYQDSFVSDYAATNPAEDIAETYRVFVTDDKPTGHSIRDQKILFMYDYSELVKIRSDIRTALELDLRLF